MDDLRKEHDDLISTKPDTMSEGEFAALIEDHKPNCPFCNDIEQAQLIPGGGDMEKTFSQEELDAAVEAAVAPIQAELASLKDSAEETEVDNRVAEAKAEADEKVAQIQKDLEDAVLEAANTKTELENVLAYLSSVKESAELAEWAEALRSHRKAQVEEASNFDEKFIEANLDRWCAESDEDFDARVSEWAASKVSKAEVEGEQASLTTSMNNVRPIEAAQNIKGDLANLFDIAANV